MPSTFDLSYRAPYDWDAIIAFLGARTISGVEVATPTAYRRIVRLGEHTGWIEVTPRPGALHVTASASLKRVLPEVRARVTHLFDLDADPATIAATLGPLAAKRPGVRVPGAFDGFEIAVRAILGQQVSVAAARTLAGRFAAEFGPAVASAHEGLTTAFPRPEEVAGRSIGLGILRSRARTILGLAEAMASGGLRLAPDVDAGDAIARLKALPGIGDWTAQYIAMRALDWPDAFPATDLWVMKALGEKKLSRVLALAEPWRPWRAYAVMHLWMGA
ncbi:MAG TPA: AlkA N-terminal domain-containing protein [Thermoanaerobaculia bacterium]